MPIDEQQIGQLIGTVSGLSTSFQTMQAAQERNRTEVIDIFKEMRDDVKNLAIATKTSSEKLADAMSQHIKEDTMVHNDVNNILEWRKGAGERIDALWDDRSKTTGILSVSRLAGGAVWSAIVLAAGYFMPHK